MKRIALLAVLAACADHSGGAATVDAGADSGSAADAGTDAAEPSPDAATGSGSAAGMPETLSLGASSGNVTDAFWLGATGTAHAPYGAISFSADVGTIDLGNGPAAAFVYATVPMAGYTLYDGLAVSPTSWDAFYLYCNGTTLADVYDERISGHGMQYQPVTGGGCSVSSAQTVAHVSLPAFSITSPEPLAGYTVNGNGISVGADGTGTLAIGTTTMPLVVFDDVDCSACGGAGWYELHSVVWDAAHQRAVFVIVYLINGQATTVELAYARSLPDLGDPIGTAVRNATWTAPAPSPRIQAGPPHGVPPPSFQLQR